jgi:hypothetical protein
MTTFLSQGFGPFRLLQSLFMCGGRFRSPHIRPESCFYKDHPQVLSVHPLYSLPFLVLVTSAINVVAIMA